MAVKKQSFEDSMARLEAIVAQLEKGECGLDQSLKLFEEGAKLAGQCEELLDKAKTLTETRQSRQTLYDRWPLFVLFILLISCEWFLRKKWGEV